MKTKFGAIIVDGRGKIGGHVASKNRHGNYLRTKVTPVNPNTASQSGVRAFFTSLSQGWRALTQAQRDAWNGAVANFAKTNIFGDLVNPSGANLYQRLNNNLLSIGAATLTEPPLPSEIGACYLTSATNAVVAATMTLVLSNSVPANTSLKIFATAPMSAGKSFVKSEFRQISVLAAAATSPVNIKAAYLAKFGSQGEIGQKIFFKAIPINSTTGQAGGVSSVSITSVG
jgi:hypothetical protein